MMIRKLDERTESYLDSIRKNLHHIKSSGSWDGIEDLLKKHYPGVVAEHVGTYPGYVNSTEIKVFRYVLNGEERYCAELCYQTDIDDYCIEEHIFSKKPRRQDVFKIRLTNDIEFEFNFRGAKAEFICWECGHKVHWLDGGSHLEEKFDRLKERYCGC